MVDYSRANRDQVSLEVWKWLGTKFLAKMGSDGMSSEESEAEEVIFKHGKREMTTTYEVLVCPWRVQQVVDYMNLINDARKVHIGQHSNRRVRFGAEKRSTCMPPVGIPRNLVDKEWLLKEKQFNPEIEEMLRIPDEDFPLMNISQIGVQQGGN